MGHGVLVVSWGTSTGSVVITDLIPGDNELLALLAGPFAFGLTSFSLLHRLHPFYPCLFQKTKALGTKLDDHYITINNIAFQKFCPD
jgi:hypothetical protein